MKALEADIENPVVSWAERRGILTTKLNLQGRRGWPDRVFWLPGGPLLIEFKRRGKKPRKLQAYVAEQLRKVGYDVRYYDSKEEAIRAIEARIAVFKATQAARLPKSRARVASKPW